MEKYFSLNTYTSILLSVGEDMKSNGRRRVVVCNSVLAGYTLGLTIILRLVAYI
jgi:hypothetical protein